MEEITRKNLLYKTKVDYTNLGGEQINNYAINHLFGCSHGCKYPCYAMSSAINRGQTESYETWCSQKIVSNALELLENELNRKANVGRVHLCFTTDPFPYLESKPDNYYRLNDFMVVHDLTIDIIDMLNSYNIPVTTLTKGLCPFVDYISNDYGESLILRAPYSTNGHYVCNPNNENYYGISLVSLDEEFRKEWEPNAAPYKDRIDSLKDLNKHGFNTWVSMEPYPALIDNVGDNFEKNSDNEYYSLKIILNEISFVDRIAFGRWNYNGDMPSDVENIIEWYNGAAKIVRGFCNKNNIECIIKKGTERAV